MAAQTQTFRIGIYGEEDSSSRERHGCGLWAAGVVSCLTAAESEPVVLTDPDDRSWDDVLDGLHGVVISGNDMAPRQNMADLESLCAWCHNHDFPILGIDHGLHVLNVSHGGTLYNDLPRELPEALQHRHPPERGLRHAMNVHPGTRLAALYGDGEVVVNSEHRRGIQRLARGFRVSGVALDGVIEAIEADSEEWFALGVQWHPASATASGLDIQLFRGLVEACQRRWAQERLLSAA